MSDVIAAFSLDQACKLTGLSESQLVDWDTTDFFQPSLAYENRRSPYSRIYSFEDIVELRTLSILRDRVSMQHLRDVASRLKEYSGKPWSDLTLYTLNR
jgi:DNA-binding transcriptional MerR regulator